jgi:hypothetical protein
MKNLALENLENILLDSADRAEKRRKLHKEFKTLVSSENLGYAEGKNAGIETCYKIMREEILRLKNKFQNGSLTMYDFEV